MSAAKSPFKVTPSMFLRYEQWAADTAAALGVSKAELVPAEDNWMHPLDAIAIVVTLGSPMTTPIKDVRNALRTHAGLSRHDRAAWVAAAMGITIESAKKYDMTRPAHDLRGASCLYRYRDSAGTLLYVGIAKDPDKREREHTRMSEWHDHAATREDQWYPNRDAALAAEREAIRTERPMFNRTRGVDPRAEKYLDEHDLDLIAEAVTK